MSDQRAIDDWESLGGTCVLYTVGSEPPEAWFWRDIRVEDRLEAVERIRRDQHGWEQGHEPAFERTTRLVRFA